MLDCASALAADTPSIENALQCKLSVALHSGVWEGLSACTVVSEVHCFLQDVISKVSLACSGAVWSGEEGQGRVAVLGSSASIDDTNIGTHCNAALLDWLLAWLQHVRSHHLSLPLLL